MKVKEESEKVGLKLNIQKTKIMASGPITSWQTEGENSKINADGDCSHEIKRRLLLGRKAMTNLDGVLKSGDVTLPTKVRTVKAMVFPVVMYECESWTIKKAERERIHAFEVWRWRRLSRVPWTARRSKQSILKETHPEYSLEGRSLKLELQHFGHSMRRASSLEKTLILGKMEGKRRRPRQRTTWLASTLQETAWRPDGTGTTAQGDSTQVKRQVSSENSWQPPGGADQREQWPVRGSNPRPWRY